MPPALTSLISQPAAAHRTFEVCALYIHLPLSESQLCHFLWLFPGCLFYPDAACPGTQFCLAGGQLPLILGRVLCGGSSGSYLVHPSTLPLGMHPNRLERCLASYTGQQVQRSRDSQKTSFSGKYVTMAIRVFFPRQQLEEEKGNPCQLTFRLPSSTTVEPQNLHCDKFPGDAGQVLLQWNASWCSEGD